MSVHGGQYILGRNVRGTAFPRTECPADNLQAGGGGGGGGWGTKFPATPGRRTRVYIWKLRMRAVACASRSS